MLKNVWRMSLTVVGVILGLFGIVWILQGINVLPVGFMAGHLQYAVLGLVAAIGGLILVLFANRRSKKNSPS